MAMVVGCILLGMAIGALAVILFACLAVDREIDEQNKREHRDEQ